MLTLLIGFRLPADRICPGATDKDTCGFHRFAASASSHPDDGHLHRGSLFLLCVRLHGFLPAYIKCAMLYPLPAYHRSSDRLHVGCDASHAVCRTALFAGRANSPFLPHTPQMNRECDGVMGALFLFFKTEDLKSISARQHMPAQKWTE